MTRIILVFAVSVMTASCSALKNSPKYNMTDGVYNTKMGGQKTQVYTATEQPP